MAVASVAQVLDTRFTPAHRGGGGSPMVLLHGFIDTWRTWELVLPALERGHEVLAPTLAGHAGGAPLPEPLTTDGVLDDVERILDEAGFATAHLVGNSLGGYVALKLAERGRARSVVALCPAGGWTRSDRSREATLALQAGLHQALRASAVHADAIVATREGRRRATTWTTVNFEHIPAELLAHQLRGAAAAHAPVMLEHATEYAWGLDPERITCPVRIVWGTADKLLPWPAAAARYRNEWLPHADWVELEEVGHCPQLDVPLETAQLILGFCADA